MKKLKYQYTQLAFLLLLGTSLVQARQSQQASGWLNWWSPWSKKSELEILKEANTALKIENESLRKLIVNVTQKKRTSLPPKVELSFAMQEEEQKLFDYFGKMQLFDGAQSLTNSELEDAQRLIELMREVKRNPYLYKKEEQQIKPLLDAFMGERRKKEAIEAEEWLKKERKKVEEETEEWRRSWQ